MEARTLDFDAERNNAHLRLIRGQVIPRWKSIVWSWQPFTALALGLIGAIGAYSLPSRNVSIQDFVGHGLTVSSIAVSACLTGLVLSLALPGSKRIGKWAKMAGPTDGFSVLSDLIFVFFWAGCSQLLAMLTCIAALFFGGDLLIGAPHPLLWTHCLSLALSLAVFAYALLQLLVVFQTLVQVGVVIIAEEQSSA